MPIARAEMQEMAESYDSENISIAGIASHSLVELGMSARRFKVPCIAVTEKGRDSLYVKYNRHLYSDVIQLDSFKDILKEDVKERLRKNNAIFIPNRSFSFYVGYDGVENDFDVPMYGNRYVLRAEDRTEGDEEKGQVAILRKAGVTIPKHFKRPEEIDRLAIVKAQQAGNIGERAFFYAESEEDYRRQARELLDKKVIDEKTLAEARIEEAVIGARFNANFHKYVLTDKFGDFDFVGTTDRRQVNLQGFLNLPAKDQAKLKIPVKNEEIGHMGVTIRESKQELLYDAAEKLFHSEYLLERYPPGIIGLCGIQGAVAYDPMDPKGKRLLFYVFDLSPRIPGDPAMGPTSPEMENLTFKHRKMINSCSSLDVSIKDPLDLSIMEIRAAAMDKRLGAIVT